MATFVFWLLLPYLIAMFVAVARKSKIPDHLSAIDLGRDIAKAARDVLKKEPAR